MSTRRFILFLFSISFNVNAQQQPIPEITFDFNDHTFNEKNNKLKMKAVSVSLVADRFGNDESAVHINGNLNSYLNLSTSSLLKPREGTISMWVNLDREVLTGHGAPYNPIIVTKNSNSRGWYNAYTIGYELATNRLTTVASIDSTKSEAVIISKDSLQFNKWYHLAIAFNDDSLFFYINNELQNKCYKGFETIYLASDSVVVGHGASTVNERFAQGSFDDIQVFHRVLDQNEVTALYKAPNPNEFMRKLSEFIEYVVIVLGAAVILLIILYRNKQKSKKEKERLELNNRITELEMQVVKTQMNPHFISNCLAAIQELIYDGDVDKAGQYIAKFSLFMRRVLNYSDKTFITLEEELELIKLNVELEQLRFKDNFEFHLKVASDVDVFEVMIPSLITQPIIENAIWHGLLPLKEKRRSLLNISIYQKENSLFIEIEDNGVGRQMGSMAKKTSKGTQLIRDRLESLSKLSSSTNYKLSIVDITAENKEPLGTKVIIELDDHKF